MAVSNMLFYFDRTMKYSSQHRQTNEQKKKRKKAHENEQEKQNPSFF